MIKGVNEFEEEIIKSILQNYPYKFYYYGSRVKGNFTKSSRFRYIDKIGRKNTL